MTGLVAEYVVEKYVIGRLAKADSSTSAVTTSMPVAASAGLDGAGD
jgi:hypothetical protein